MTTSQGNNYGDGYGSDCGNDKYNLNITPGTAVTPEPASLVLLATGLLTLAGAASLKRLA